VTRAPALVRVALAALVAALLSGCGAEATEPSPEGEAGGTGAAGTGPGASGSGGAMSSGEIGWAGEVHASVQQTCGTCHKPPGGSITPYDAPGWFGGDNAADAYAQAISYVVPGDPESSEMYQRITAVDGVGRMPPQVPAGEELVTLIHDWIAAGAAP